MPAPADDLAACAVRRARLMDAMGATTSGGVMLLAAAPERPRTADQLYPFRQDSDFAYVTGFPEPGAVAVLAPGQATPYVLFVQPHDKEHAVWVGARAGIDGARDLYGATAHPLDALETELPKLVREAGEVWLQLARDDALAGRLGAVVRRVQAERPRSGKGPTVLREANELLHEQRLRKAPEEITRLRGAIAIAADAHLAAMRAARPGVPEYEIEALVDYTFRRRGASGPAYPSIVASGPGATILHYTDNDRTMRDDELLLLDAGAEHGGYCADITRTFPVGRRFTPAQRDLYEVVLASQLSALATAKPGATLEDVHAKALRVLCEGLVHLGLIAGSVDEAITEERYKPLYMHRTSHWLGRDVHDVGLYKHDGVARPLEPGMVFTVEPGCYVAADQPDVPEAFRGIGIRIEDDVLVTADGIDVLTQGIPKHVAELEALRGEALSAT